jgi:catechol 2,3-dioxygenase-like lactoylglutathione lyase family enzyme
LDESARAKREGAPHGIESRLENSGDAAMPVTAMNHFTVLTDDLETTLAFYAEHLGLEPGARPPFAFPGAWLYARGGSEAILHVIAGRQRAELVKGAIDHMAFSATGLVEAVDRLKSQGRSYELRKLPGYGTWQLFFLDPNGAKVELDFDPAEPGPAA